MATEAQVLANRLNAQKSTGPRTEEGKALAAQNSLKHGFWAKEVVVKGEDGQEYERLRAGMWAEMAPVGDRESELAGHIIDLHWRLRRASRVQRQAFDALYDKKVLAHCGYVSTKKRQEALQAPVNEWLQTLMVLEDLAGDRQLDRLQVQERRIESCLYRTMDRLDKMQDRRRTGGPGANEAPARGATTNVTRDDEQRREEVSSVKSEVSSAQSEASSGGSVLETSHFSFNTVLCETNPIPGDAVERQVPGTPEVRSDSTASTPACGSPVFSNEGLVGSLTPPVPVG